jgi:membrane protein DedA with SNARE-associated domain
MMAIESACLPLPSEIIMPFAGYLVSVGRFNLFWVATAGAIGCNIGSAIAYAVGYFGGPPFIRRWGRYVLLSEHELGVVERFFARYGAAAVLIGRLLPMVRTFIALPAGIARMPQLKFHIYTFVGSWPWCLGLAWIGLKLGEQWDRNPTLRAVFHRADLAVVAIVVLAAAWFVWSRLRGRTTKIGPPDHMQTRR